MSPRGTRPDDTSPRDTSPPDDVETSARAFVQTALNLRHIDLSLLAVGQHPVFRVASEAGAFIAKVFSRDDSGWKRERAGLTLFGDNHAPRLVAEGQRGRYALLLTELVPGRDLRHRLLANEDPRFLERALAHAEEVLDDVHRRLASVGGELDEIMATDPLLTLTEADRLTKGLTRALVPARLGPKRCDQIHAVMERRADFDALLKDTCVGHGDFQARNLVVADDGRIHVIDWEMLRRGPRVGDHVSLRRFRAWPSARVTEEVAVTYDLVKVSVGVSRSAGWSDDLPVWLGYIDACLAFLEQGERPALTKALSRLLSLV